MVYLRRSGLEAAASLGCLVLVNWALVETSIAHAEIIAGRVVGITDGPTVRVQTPSPENREIKVRLAGIDAQERYWRS